MLVVVRSDQRYPVRKRHASQDDVNAPTLPLLANARTMKHGTGNQPGTRSTTTADPVLPGPPSFSTASFPFDPAEWVF